MATKFAPSFFLFFFLSAGVVIAQVQKQISDAGAGTANFILIPVVIVFVFLIFIFYRIRRETFFRKKQKALSDQLSEVGMKALRAQINPHFIFNCLSSVLNSMQKNEKETAEQYLRKFTNLLRAILENSAHREVPMSEDLNALELYMQIEQIHMQQVFSYRFEIQPEINSEQLLIPPLLLQPFVENAIKHGMAGKKEGGEILIKASKKGEMILFEITDNGTLNGMQAGKSLQEQTKKSSMGLSITRERLDLLGRITGTKPSCNLTDRKDAAGNYAGKKVEILLPCIVEE